jgi:hypothetical protein
MTHRGGFMARESRDGKLLYFSKNGTGSLWRMRLTIDGPGASPEEMIIGPGSNIQPAGWILTPDTIFFTDVAGTGQAGSLRAYQFSTGATRLIVPLLRTFMDSRYCNLTVSPDSKWILYSQLDRSGSNVMVAENR